MGEPFKELVNERGVREVGGAISRALASFREDLFVESATRGLAELALKARVQHVARALRPLLPAAWPEAADVLVRALPAPLVGEEGVSTGFHWWPVLQVVEDHAADPEVSLPALREMTRRFSAEFAVRPYLERHPRITFAFLEEAARSDDLHVRRWASEGSRPRLPWGLRLRASVTDPTPGLRILERLIDDPSAYVRRSVANHLGDVAKDHPERACDLAARWVAERPDRAALVKHGLRSLAKLGHPRALALSGASDVPARVGSVAITPQTAEIGGEVVITAPITALRAGVVRVDVRWEWPAARGGWSGRTFRGGERDLKTGETWDFRHRLSLRPVSTRPLRPGPQRVLLRVQGEDSEAVGFVVVAS